MADTQEMTIEDQLTLEYHGPITEGGRMGSYDVAGYIIAFSDYVGVISREVYGEKISLETDIQGFNSDSFDIVFALQVAGIATTLFSGSSPLSIKEFIDLIKELVKAWLHLDGHPPKKIERVPDKQNTLQIENQNGQLIYVSADAINIIGNPKAGKAVEQFIKKPLEAGASYVRVNSKAQAEVVRIDKQDAPSFIPVDIETPLIEGDMTMMLLIEAPTFREGNKWRFNDGQNSFLADILDQEFLKKVDAGVERFGKGDQLTATVKFVQTGTIGSLKLERSIIKVLDHKIPSEPEPLFPTERPRRRKFNFDE